MFPTDVVYSNLQKRVIMNNGQKTTVREVVRDLVAKKGWTVFYQGLGTSVARSCIVAPSRFVAYEFTLQFLEKYLQ